MSTEYRLNRPENTESAIVRRRAAIVRAAPPARGGRSPPADVTTYDLGIASAVPASIALVFGLSQVQALVILFVFLPIAVAAVVVPLVAWRSSSTPTPILTSEILANGIPAEAEILSFRSMGGIVDMRPMVRFVLRVSVDADEEPFDLEVVQSLPRMLLSGFRIGDVVEVRLTPDHSAGAVVWGIGPPAE